RRVQVLRAVVVRVELARAERDRLPGQVPDRPQQPAAEHVDERAPAAPPGQARLGQLVVGEAARPQVPGQLVPRGRREADTETLGTGKQEAALRQEGACELCRVMQHSFAVKILSLLMRLDQPAAMARLLARHVPALLVAELEARAGGQALDRLAELEGLDL